MKRLTFGSLFAGIGGFDLGLERAGMECRWQVEIDDYASRVLAKHWPSVARWGDARTFPVDESSQWQVDLICAGVPCQPVSIAGKQKGADDERWMWGETLRIIADLGPRFFVAENPASILSHDRGRTFSGILRALASAGYVCEWHVISAADVGAPHLRKRVWLVAHSDSIPCAQGKPRRACRSVFAASAGSQRREDEGETRAVIRGRSEDALANSGSQGLERTVLERTGKGLPRLCGGEGRNKKQEMPKAIGGWWQAEPAVGRVAHGISNRLDRLRCLGNAVVPQIVELIGRAIIDFDRRLA